MPVLWLCTMPKCTVIEWQLCFPSPTCSPGPRMADYQDRFTMRTCAWKQWTSPLVAPSDMPGTMLPLCWWTSAMPGAVWEGSYQSGLPHSCRSARDLDKLLQQLGRYRQFLCFDMIQWFYPHTHMHTVLCGKEVIILTNMATSNRQNKLHSNIDTATSIHTSSCSVFYYDSSISFTIQALMLLHDLSPLLVVTVAWNASFHHSP